MDEVLALLIPVNYNPHMAQKHDMNKNINRTMNTGFKGEVHLLCEWRRKRMKNVKKRH